ncbi:hypothetical protein NDU88_001460 [Pleurodeles waltl]|uniref:Uncharacterized protein n=1 Tax=Pleurodeles waltl TaxID=8319 RepID=A0AAV7S7P1_PLEWA|nr:hypothetical protein NDU88_001460 [Pleurodeles waltl]
MDIPTVGDGTCSDKKDCLVILKNTNTRNPVNASAPSAAAGAGIQEGGHSKDQVLILESAIELASENSIEKFTNQPIEPGSQEQLLGGQLVEVQHKLSQQPSEKDDNQLAPQTGPGPGSGLTEKSDSWQVQSRGDPDQMQSQILLKTILQEL